MRLHFDHLVHFTRNPEQAAEQMKKQGFRAHFGGQHTIWGTYNTLSFYGLSYIEWIAIKDQTAAKHVTDNHLIKQLVKEQEMGDHLVTFAIRTDDIQGLSEHLKRNGANVAGPVEGSRLKEDGSLLQWKMLFIEGDEHPYPFFIEWGKSDAERLEELKEVQNDSRYRIDALFLAVKDLKSAVKRFSELFGLETGTVHEDHDLKATCQRIRLQGGDLILCQPQRSGGLVHNVLEKSGPHPFMLSITGEGKEQAKSSIADALYSLPG